MQSPTLGIMDLVAANANSARIVFWVEPINKTQYQQAALN